VILFVPFFSLHFYFVTFLAFFFSGAAPLSKTIVRLENGDYDKTDFICDIRDYLRIMGALDD
jgi:hypothetical protein